MLWSFPRWLSGQESTLQCKRCVFNPWARKTSWKRARQPTPVFLPGESRGQKSLSGYSPQGHKELDMTEATHHTNTCIIPQLKKKKAKPTKVPQNQRCPTGFRVKTKFFSLPCFVCLFVCWSRVDLKCCVSFCCTPYILSDQMSEFVWDSPNFLPLSQRTYNNVLPSRHAPIYTVCSLIPRHSRGGLGLLSPLLLPSHFSHIRLCATP